MTEWIEGRLFTERRGAWSFPEARTAANVGVGMFPATRDSNRLPHQGSSLFVLIVIAFQGCALPWNGSSGVPGDIRGGLTLDEKQPGMQKNSAQAYRLADADTVEVTTDVRPKPEGRIQPPGGRARANLPAIVSIDPGGRFNSPLAANIPNRIHTPSVAAPIRSAAKKGRSTASPALTQEMFPPVRTESVTQANYETTAQSSAHMSVVVMQQPATEVESAPAPDAEAPEPNGVDPQLTPAELPPVTGPVRIPLEGADPDKDIELTMKDGRVSLVTRNASVQSVLNLLAEHQGLNLVAADDVTASISVTLSNVAFEDALNAIVSIAGCTWTQKHGIMLVSKLGGESQGSPDVQGKIVQVYPLNFVASVDIEATIKGLLSPTGQVFTSQTSPTDKRRTQELVVVEDIPASVSRVTQYIEQVDQAPRQVMIEAHVLEVDLRDDTRHGVNWDYITQWVGRDIALKTVGFANPAASPASFFSLDGEHLDLVIEALKTTTDAKTLASPKVIVANGQEARIQIGSKLGYFVTTTTQTSTLQNVNFLNTGVLLKVTPQISNDGRVLMVVSPEVSTGRISAAGLPETNTTEAMTTVLLENNGGMVIGGLIKESDSDTQDKVPVLGDLWLVGRLFQKRNVARQRSEIIIVLVPHIAPYDPEGVAIEQTEIYRATTPIFQKGLTPAIRPFEPVVPDAINTHKRKRFFKQQARTANPSQPNPQPGTLYSSSDDNGPVTSDQPYFEQSVGNPPIEPYPQPPLTGINGIAVPPPSVPAPAKPQTFLAPTTPGQN